MIFITGASGLLGASLIETLVNSHDGATDLQIRALYRKQIPAIKFAEKIEWIEGDILDVVVLEEALKGVSEVYHCAAIVSFDPKQKQRMHATNIDGTANVVNACIDANIKKLLFVSSVAALGRIREDGPINETMNWSEETSNSEYGKTKYLAEMEVWRGIGEGLDAVIVNPVIILGSGDWNGGSSGIFKSAYNEFPWYTDGMSGFVDVLDVVDAMQILMESNVVGQRYVLSAENIHYRDIFNAIAKAFDKKFITDFEKQLAYQANSRGLKGVICGHIHKPENKQIQIKNKSIHYLNCGDWIENNSYIEFSKNKFKLYGK